MTQPPRVRVRRIYEEVSPDDGVRVLVDRLWPRGMSKERAQLDLWLKEIAPSTELRTWYGHDPEKFDEFTERYRAELDEVDRSAALVRLRKLADDGVVTLLTASKAVDISEAAVLGELLGAN